MRKKIGHAFIRLGLRICGAWSAQLTTAVKHGARYEMVF
jgi:hypothetical protein